jgi:hypothetical protein
MSDVRILSAQLRTAHGTAGAIINLAGGDQSEVQTLRGNAATLGRRVSGGGGTLGLALSGDANARLRRAIAHADSVRALVASRSTSLGRLRGGDSTLLRTVEDARNELSIARALLDEPRGTAGRFLRDSAIVREAARAQLQIDSIVADIKYHPLRYWPF